MLVGDQRDLLCHVPGKCVEDGEKPVDDKPGRNEHRPLLLHQLCSLLVEERSVLDCLCPSPKGRHDPRLAVTVGCNDPISPRGLSDDRLQFLVGELLVDRMVDLTHHSTGSTDLDDRRTPPELLANGAKALGDAVTQCAESDLPICDEVERIAVHVAVATSHRENVSRRIEVRSDDRAFVDGDAKIQPQSGHLADARHATVERATQVGRRPGGAQANRILVEDLEIRSAEAPEVAVTFPEAGHGNGDLGHAARGVRGARGLTGVLDWRRCRRRPSRFRWDPRGPE